MHTADLSFERTSRRRVSAIIAALLPLLVSATLLAQPQPISVSGGDIRIGDRIVVKVDGEAQLSDTFTVTSGPALILPVVGSIPLAGVRRENIEKQLTAEIGRFIRNPNVKARLLVRLAVIGEVGRPGFYAVPIEALVNDVLMFAGGPTKDAKVEAIRIQRNGVATWPKDSLRAAMAQGLTLNQLDVQPEDVIFVPKALNVGTFWQVFATVLTTTIAIYSMTRLHR
jgi:protein involved in polysaccharide export with SLBB domain